jgi:hypothetical protein
MSTRTKLVIANVLMCVGAVPLAFFVLWVSGLLTWISGHQAIIPIGDPLRMFGPLILSFLFTAAVAGTSAAWSWDLVRSNPQSRSRAALGLRLMTAALLISPFAMVFLMSFLTVKPSLQGPQWLDSGRYSRAAIGQERSVTPALVEPKLSNVRPTMQRVPRISKAPEELDELQEIARVATRTALEGYEPMPEEWKNNLTLGAFSEGDERVFELYIAAENPADAVVISTARVNCKSRDVVVTISNRMERKRS